MLLIKNIRTIYLCSTSPVPFLKGQAMYNLPTLDNAFIVVENGLIHNVGSMASCPVWSGETIDATGCLVIPAWIDCHTHLVFAAWRESEFVDRIRGLSYQDIALKGGGILNSAKKLREISEEELYRISKERLDEVIAQGTGAIEIKSGYGLNTDSELKMLRVIRRLKENSPIPVKATFLGAHSFPLEYASDHEGYISLLVNEMLPQIAKEKLADYVDVFCEKNFFSVEETQKIISAASQYGLKSRIHVNQFTHSGGIQMAIQNNAISVEHLEVLNDEEIDQLKQSDTVPVLLPGAPFFLHQDYPPARKIIDQGMGLVLASDFNPGTSPSYNMSFILSLACIKMKMLPEEALAAMTINAAYTLGLEQSLGSVEPGKMANLLISRPCENLSFLPYFFGKPWIQKILIMGNPEF